jgi:hypothetical protein
MSTSTSSARPPYDPELAPALAASPLPQTVTLDMVGALRGASFGPTVDDLLAGRPLDREDRTFAARPASSPPRCSGPGARRRPARHLLPARRRHDHR